MDQFTSQINPESQNQNNQNPKPKKGSFLLDWFETVAIAVVLFLVLNTVTSRVRVYNISMEPTLQQGYLLVVNKLAYRVNPPGHGDIIVFHFQGNSNEDYIKRVIGLPGDTVTIDNGVVKVNGAPLTEPYLLQLPAYSGSWKVPEGKLFVLGDNRNNSSDSHQWGFVDMSWVVGKAVLIYWPIQEFRVLSHPELVSAHP